MLPDLARTRRLAAATLVVLVGCEHAASPPAQLRWERDADTTSTPIALTPAEEVRVSDRGGAGWQSSSSESVRFDDEGVRFFGPPSHEQVFRRWRIDTDRFGSARLRVDTTGDARFELEWVAQHGGDSVHGSIQLGVRGAPAPQWIACDLRGHDAWRGVTDGVVLRCLDRTNEVRVLAMQITVDSPGRSEDGLWFIGNDGRRAVEIEHGTNWSLASRGLKVGDRAEWSIGVRRATASRTSPLGVLIESDGEVSRVDVSREAGWQQVTWIATSTPSDGSFAVRLDGEAGDAVLVTTPKITTPARTTLPNVVLITADTLRADYLSVYGDEVTQTPAIDGLARDGVTFLDCTSAANVTLPSHASILTSLFPKDHGCESNARMLDSELTTLAELLAGQGYVTGASIGSAVLDPRSTAIDQGFGEFFDLAGAVQRDGAEVTGDALRFVDRHRERPFFLWVHYYDPHRPYRAPDDIVRRYYDGADPNDPTFGPPLPKDFGGATDPRYAIAQYRAEITSMDREIGRLLERVRAIGEPLVCFVADHGESMRENQIFYSHEGLFPNTVMVPWIVTGPGVPRGLVRRDPVETVDVTPTLLALLGVAPPRVARGVARLGAAPEEGAPRVRFFQHSNGVSVGARGPRFHGFLHLRQHRRGDDPRDLVPGAVELYEIGERGQLGPDVASQRDAESDGLRRAIAAWLSDTAGFTSVESLTEQRRAALKELGYLDGD